MKFCQSHWVALRTAVEARGLGHLIAANSRDAFSRTVAELEGKAEADDFDPLMAAHNMILSKVTQDLGLYLFIGDYCPVCEACMHYQPPPDGHRYATNEAYFIDGPADAVREIAAERGLL